ncbi:MAG: flagellar motor switch protein FliG [Deltaproteobacteria bacterium]|nr:flagellar motor switch protein FliG [Deltaproteobacteria bacterium]
MGRALNPKEKLSGLQKAAVLLMYLGKEAAAKVFENFSDNEVQAVSRCMMEIDHVPGEVLKQIVREFEQCFTEDAGIYVEGDAFVRNILESALDKERADYLMENLTSFYDNHPLETISSMEAKTVSGLLVGEHPQTIALILSTQKNEHTAKILGGLPDELRGDVLYRMARIDRVSPEIVSQIEKALQKEIGGMSNKEYQHVGGIDKVVEIMGRMEKGSDQAALEIIEESDREMAEEIRKRMFTFEDMVKLDPRALQKILREINSEQLVLALKTASDDLKNAIFKNVSQRAADMMKEDLEALGPVKLSEVEAMQSNIVKVAFRLQEEGQITIPGRGGDDVLV